MACEPIDTEIVPCLNSRGAIPVINRGESSRRISDQLRIFLWAFRFIDPILPEAEVTAVEVKEGAVG